MKGRVSVRACEGLQRLFHRQRHEAVQEQDTRWGTLMSEDPAITLPSGESDASDETGHGPRSKRAGGERTKFKFTAPP